MKQAFLGVLPDGTVNTVGIVDDAGILEAFRAGEIIVPCTLEQARVQWGQKVDPLNLEAAPHAQ